jgi:hypothetical protein
MSENKRNNSDEVHTDLSKSFCIESPEDKSPDGFLSNDDCPNDETQECGKGCKDTTECPGGVCPLQKKRKMRPPVTVEPSPGLPSIDNLFSQLFGNVLEKSNDTSTPNPSSQLGNILRQNMDNRLNDDTDHDSEYSEDEDGDSEDDEDSECDHQECHLDVRWNVINKLLDSHLILSNTVADLIGNEHEHNSVDKSN